MSVGMSPLSLNPHLFPDIGLLSADPAPCYLMTRDLAFLEHRILRFRSIGPRKLSAEWEWEALHTWIDLRPTKSNRILHRRVNSVLSGRNTSEFSSAEPMKEIFLVMKLGVPRLPGPPARYCPPQHQKVFDMATPKGSNRHIHKCEGVHKPNSNRCCPHR